MMRTEKYTDQLSTRPDKLKFCIGSLLIVSIQYDIFDGDLRIDDNSQIVVLLPLRVAEKFSNAFSMTSTGDTTLQFISVEKQYCFVLL